MYTTFWNDTRSTAVAVICSPTFRGLPLTQDEYADASDPLPEGLIGNLKEFRVSYTEVGGVCPCVLSQIVANFSCNQVQ